MFSGIFDDSFHNIFLKGEWNIEKIKTHFGDTPAILINVLRRRSCTVGVVKLLLKHGADVNYQSECGDSPLMTALEISNDQKVIRELLEEGADVNELDGEGSSPLLSYLQREDCSVDIVELLLDFNADVNHVLSYGESALAAAIRNSKDDAVIRVLVEGGAELNDLRDLFHIPLCVLLRERKDCLVDTINFLLENGADINCVDEFCYTPLEIALQQSRDEAVIQALLERGADVNMFCNTKSPLLIYLGRRGYRKNICSVGIVKLLLRYKANVNAIGRFGDSPLVTALKESRSEEVIRILLENGADVNTLDGSLSSPLCIAFRHSSHDIVKLLLDAGSSLNACKFHSSVLFCATDNSHAGLREDVLALLLKTNDVNSVNEYGQSVLCNALQCRAKAHEIQLLLNAGASLNACKKHSLPLICATDCSPGTPLTADVVRLLLNNGASVDDKGLKILQDALCYCRYETRAIQFLLDLPGMDAYVVANKLLLHLAVENSNCRRDVVKLLVNRKAQVHSINQNEETPLHCAARNISCDPSIINFLLQNGSLVNAKNKSDETPLMLAVKEHQPANILKELLIFDAHIGKTKFCNRESPLKCELLEFLASRPEMSSLNKNKNSYKMLLKFFLLQNPECKVEDFQRYPVASPYLQEQLVVFMNKCLSELEKMRSLQVGHGHTFCTFVSRYCLSVEKMYDLDQILICLMENTFPEYFDVIAARIGRLIMEAEIKKLQLYASKIRPDMLYGERIYLNSDVMLKISHYLPDEDLLKFILGFYKPVNQNNSVKASKDDSLLGKRNAEPSFNFIDKHPRLYC